MVGGRSVKAAVKFSVRQLANTRYKPRPHDWRRAALELALKLRQHRVPLMVSACFVLFGIAYYALVEPDKSLRHIILVSLSVRAPVTDSDLSGLYQLTLPIFLEVIFFGFILTALVDRYDPVAMGRILAGQLHNHTVVVGFTHLGERIAANLRERNRPFCVVDASKDAVADLLAVDEPVVVGDLLDLSTLEAANVRQCKEVLILADNLQQTFVLSFHLRSLSPHCKLYIDISNHEEFREYFVAEPFRAHTLSISRFAVESLREWTSPSNPPSLPTTPRTAGAGAPSASDAELNALPPLSLRPIMIDSRGGLDAVEPDSLPAEAVAALTARRIPVRSEPPVTTVLIIGSDACAREFVKFMLRERVSWSTIVVDEGLSEHFLSDAVDSDLCELHPQSQPDSPHSLESLPKEMMSLAMHRRRSYARIVHVPAETGESAESGKTSKAKADSRRRHHQHHHHHQPQGEPQSAGDASSSSSASAELPGRRKRIEVNAHLALVNCTTKRLRHIAEQVDFSLISFVFITWPEEHRVSDAIYLCMALHRQFPHIKLYVRIFDDQLREVLESFGATIFSTSSYAYNMLRREVPPDSNLYSGL